MIDLPPVLAESNYGHFSPIMKTMLILVVALLTASPVLSAEIISLKSTSGTEISGSIMPGEQPNSIHVTRNDGSLFKNVPILSLTIDSQQKVAKALDEYQKEKGNADITKASQLSITFQRQKASNNNKYGDIDDRIVKIQPLVILESNEREKEYKDIKGEVIIVGKEVVSKDRWVILNRQKFNFSSIKPDQKVSWEGKEFECRYDPDYAGFDYEGHVIVLHNKAGEVTMVRGSAKQWEDALPNLLKASELTGYNKDFSTTLDLRSTFGLPGMTSR